MQYFPMGSVRAYFYAYTAYLYAFYPYGAAVCTGRCVAGADDRACGLFGRKIGTVPVRYHVRPRV